ncbi:MAG: hypothetical protein IKT40_05925 [Bacilli bacterium]|nr:hypothetical protein [Bacilli bacterium]
MKNKYKNLVEFDNNIFSLCVRLYKEQDLTLDGRTPIYRHVNNIKLSKEVFIDIVNLNIDIAKKYNNNFDLDFLIQELNKSCDLEIENIDQIIEYFNDSGYSTVNILCEFINYLFYWNDTKLGYDFYSQIYKEYKSYIKTVRFFQGFYV